MPYDVQVTAIVKLMEGFVEKLASKLNLDIVGSLIKDTPVDTGWARANWVPSITQTVDVTSGTRANAELGQIDHTPQQSGIAAIASQYKLKLGSLFITNNVDYITKLNEGSSRKAPSAFVQAAIEKAITRNGGRA